LDEYLTPREIVEELDKYIIGQEEAKRAVAVALRNRYRRQQMDPELRDEVIPKNILMIGPTGVGKTEIARRLANLAHAPFVKVEATKFTEVGYVGRDVDAIVRDLVEVSVRMVEQERFAEVEHQAEELAEHRILEILAPALEAAPARGTGFSELINRLSGQSTPEQPPASEVEQEARRNQIRQYEANRKVTERRLRAGELEDEEIEVEVEESGQKVFQIWSSSTGVEEMGFNPQEMLGNLFGPRKSRKRMTVAEARRALTYEEAEKLVDPQEVAREAIERVEQAGIVFLDELDKIAGREGGHGPEVSREGVQRDILPIIEGSTVITKYGPCNTNHILFMAAGAFHVSKPSDLIPELQGRFPIRVELKSLTEADFARILVEPQNSLVKQYTALLATEGIDLEFAEGAITTLARTAREVNERAENIGARRLYTLMERVLDDLSFEAPELGDRQVVVDEAYVDERLQKLTQDQDLTRFML